MKYFVNPGVNPELMQAALALSERNDLRYFTSFVGGKGGILEKFILYVPEGSKFRQLLERRVVPLEARLIINSGIFWEILQVLCRSRMPRLQHYFIKRRNCSVHNKARKWASFELPQFAFLHYTDALKTIKFLRQLGCLTILNYPIAHHAWMKKIMLKEREINPNLAIFLQVPDTKNGNYDNLSREIDACDKIIVGSTFVKETFEDEGIDPKKISVVNLGSNQNMQSLGMGRDYPFLKRNQPLRLVYTGQIIQRKGLSYLFDALTKLDNSTVCDVIGVCPDPSYLQNLKIPNNVNFLGYRNRSQIEEIYLNCDVFVLPSLAEGFPLAAIEAMASGLSLIITKNTFASDVVTNGINGFVIEAQSTHAIVSAVRNYLENPDLVKNMGFAAEVSSRKYTWAVYHEKILNFLDNL